MTTTMVTPATSEPQSTPAPAAAPAASAPAPAPAPAATDWTASLPDETKAYVASKGFKDVTSVVDSYRNFEKLQGVPAENVLKLPTRPDDVEGWNNIYNRLGRPSKPEEYGLTAPEKGGDPEFAKFASGIFHEAGLSKVQGEKIVAKWNDYVKGQLATIETNKTAAIAKEDAALKTEWGQAWEQNVKIGEQAYKTFGLTDKQVNAIEHVLGFANTMKLFHQIGSRLGEDKFVTSTGTTGFQGVMTPAQARGTIAQRKADPDFTKRYLNGGAAEKAEMEKLYAAAYPDESKSA